MKLSADDAHHLLRLIGELHAAATPEELAESCRHVLARLIPADLHDIVVLGGADRGQDLYLGTPGGYTVEEKTIAVTTGYEHPVVAFYVACGDRGPRRISDVTSTDRYRDSAFYQSHSRRLGQIHEMDAILPGVSDCGMAGIAVSRSGRDFSDRDLAILGHLRGPLGLALDRQLVARRRHRAAMQPTDELSVERLATVFPALTRREAEVLRWVAEGKRDGEIALILGIRAATATTHVRDLLAKLDVDSRVVATVRALAALHATRATEVPGT